MPALQIPSRVLGVFLLRARQKDLVLTHAQASAVAEQGWKQQLLVSR